MAGQGDCCFSASAGGTSLGYLQRYPNDMPMFDLVFVEHKRALPDNDPEEFRTRT